MEIFHSYVSLPEGITKKMGLYNVNPRFINSGDVRCLLAAVALQDQATTGHETQDGRVQPEWNEWNSWFQAI